MADEREVTIVIKGKNLTAAEFAAARKGLAGLNDEVDKNEKQAKKARVELGTFGQAWRQLTGAFTAANLITDGIRGLASFAREGVAVAGQLVDMSNKTGLSIEFLQRAGFVARQTGTDMSTIADAIQKMTLQVAKGGTEVRDGIRALGLEYDSFKRLSPEQQFQQIIQKLAGVANQQARTLIGTQIFTQRSSSAVLQLVDDWSKLADQASIVGEAQIRSLDSAADAWERWKDKAKAAITDTLGTIALFGEKVSERGLLGTASDALSTAWNNPGQTLLRGPQGVLEMLIERSRFEAELDTQMRKRAQTTTGVVVPAEKSYAEQLAAAQRALRGLDADTKRQIVAGFELGKSVKDVAQSLGVSEEAVELYKAQLQESTQAQKKASDATDAHTKKLQEFTDELSGDGAIKAANDLLRVLKDLPPVQHLTKEAQAKISDVLGKALDVYRALGREAPQALREIYDETTRNTKVADLMAQANASAIKEQRAFFAALGERADELTQQQVQQVQTALAAAVDIGHEFHDTIATATERAIAEAGRWRDESLRAIAPLETQMPEIYANARINIQGQYELMVADARNAAQRQAGFFQEVWAGLPDVVMQALQGGGNVGASVTSFLGNQLIGEASQGPLGGLLQRGLGSMLSRTASGSMMEGILQGVSNAIPGLGPLIGAGISALGRGLANVFGFGNRTREAREDFATQLGFGNLDKLYADLEKMGEAGQRLRHIGLNIVGRNDEAANRRWMDEVRKFYADAETAQNEELQARQELQAAVEKYGFTIEELGPKWREQRLTDEATALYKDFRILTASGIEFDTVITRMGPSLSTLAQNAIKTGGTLDKSMEAALQRAIDLGVLFDENGEKITSLEGIKFGETFSESVDRMIAKLDELIRKLSGEVADAITDIPDVDVDVTVHTKPGRQEDGTEDSGPQYASGTRNLDFVGHNPLGERVTLHGREAVIPEGGGHQLAREMARAWAQMQHGQPRGSGDPSIRVLEFQVDGHAFARATIEVTQGPMSRGELPMPRRSVRQRVSHG